MSTFVVALTFLVLAIFLGFELITKVPPTLHTPLMSGSNAISGITLVGAVLSAGTQYNNLTTGLAVAAVVFATVNVVGGLSGDQPHARNVPTQGPLRTITLQAQDLFQLGYLAAACPLHSRTEGTGASPHRRARQPARRLRHAAGRRRSDVRPQHHRLQDDRPRPGHRRGDRHPARHSRADDLDATAGRSIQRFRRPGLGAGRNGQLHRSSRPRQRHPQPAVHRRRRCHCSDRCGDLYR